jgi:hypothetical protein
MVFLTILFCIAFYIVLAVLFVNFVKNRTDIKFYKWLAVAFVILLPTWDVALGYLVYFPACMFMPKAVIYETAETEGIYYERKNNSYLVFDRRGRNMPDEELINVDHIDEPLMKGFKFAESKVNQKYSELEQKNITINPLIYRCKAVPKHEDSPQLFRTSCFIVDTPQSNYLVKVITFKIGVTEINSKIIYDRTKTKLLAKQNMVNFLGFNGGLWFVPFFNWLDWGWGSKFGSMNCPDVKLYDEFEFKVLKPKI